MENQPMMYISQPEFKTAQGKMQQTFVARRKKVTKNESKPNTSAEQPPTEGKKGFKDMSIEEKIQYLMNLPYGIPKIKCEFKTDQDTYKGIVQSYEKEQVVLLVSGKPNKITLNVKDIQSVNMLSF